MIQSDDDASIFKVNIGSERENCRILSPVRRESDRDFSERIRILPPRYTNSQFRFRLTASTSALICFDRVFFQFFYSNCLRTIVFDSISVQLCQAKQSLLEKILKKPWSRIKRHDYDEHLEHPLYERL